MQLYGNKIQSVLHPVGLLLIGLVSQLQASPPPLDLIRGHYEVQMEYDETDGWFAGVSYTLGANFDTPAEGDIGRINPDEVEIVLPGLARRLSNSASDFLIPTGTLSWRIPQGSQRGNHFLGFRVLIPNRVFEAGSGDSFFPGGSGNVNLRLLSITGSGSERGGLVGVWQDGSGFEPQRIAFETSDGIDEDDEVSILTPNTHTHYNWIFTEPGVYEVNMEVYGKLRNGPISSHPFTLTFQVPHDGVLSSLNASLAFENGEWELLSRDLDTSVTYAERHCYLQATEPSNNPAITGWQVPFIFAINNPATSDTVGIAEAFATTSPNFAGGVRLQLAEHIGPGDIVALDGNEESLFDTRDGLDGDDSWLISSATTSGQLHFTEEGVHHLSFIATGLDSSGNPMSISRPLHLRCGANLAPDHSYAEWADSYERAANLTAGALADPNGNFDNDGFPNNMEYLLDAMGANPVGKDGFSCFDASTSPPRFVFMRDLHKDDLDNSSPALFSSQSFDLLTWERLDASNTGVPVSLHEVPIVTGNARSMFMERSLSNPNGDSSASFFQLSTN